MFLTSNSHYPKENDCADFILSLLFFFADVDLLTVLVPLHVPLQNKFIIELLFSSLLKALKKSLNDFIESTIALLPILINS